MANYILTLRGEYDSAVVLPLQDGATTLSGVVRCMDLVFKSVDVVIEGFVVPSAMDLSDWNDGDFMTLHQNPLKLETIPVFFH